MFIVYTSPSSRNGLIWPREVSPGDHLFVGLMMILLRGESCDHYTHRIARLVNAGFVFLFSLSFQKKMWIFFLGKPDIARPKGALSLRLCVCFLKEIFF